jgi:hypothetical protein
MINVVSGRLRTFEPERVFWGFQVLNTDNACVRAFLQRQTRVPTDLLSSAHEYLLSRMTPDTVLLGEAL